ncbi:MAG: cobalamin biosynthesis protein [Spirochaetaceae bacterium]|nr:cobalamin biosynthesis protein [Spirochaetaceae bacterium]
MIIDHIPLLILSGAILIDFLFGEVPNLVHPVVWMGSYIKTLWHIRPGKNKISLFLWGVLIILTGLFLFSIIPHCLLLFLPEFLKILISLFMVTISFSMKALIRAVREVQSALESNDLPKARDLTSWHLVSRDTGSLSSEEIVSAVIESAAENITDGFTSPLIYYSVGGPPAAWAYRFINTSDSMIAYRKNDFEWGGKFTARIDDVLNWIPARISGFLICLSAFLLKENWKKSFLLMIRSHGKTSSPNAGWTMAAMAGALEITLEKKGDYSLSGGTHLRNFQLIDRALKIVNMTMILIMIFCIFLLEVIY